jgi:uncharacterized protein (TIGR03032 family)
MSDSNPNLPPFTCACTPEVAKLLNDLGISIAITTYQAGKLIFLSGSKEGTSRQLPRDFIKPMGLVIDDKKMALAVKNELVVFADAKELAIGYPKKPGFYDSFFVPRAIYNTGEVDIHDIAWDSNGRLCAVNTLFSCIAYINDSYSFEPLWAPPFIHQLASEDFCHLNGMAMVNGSPKYVSMFANTSTPKGWRENVLNGGLIMDIETNTIVVDGLAMPHSPRWFNQELYCLLSATGELIKIDIGNHRYSVVTKHNGFVRGLAQHGDYLFVGLSKYRKSSSENRALPIMQNEIECGIDVVHLPSATIVGSIRYLSSVEEIYDVQILQHSLRPGILNHTTETHKQCLYTPGAGFWIHENEGNQTHL